MVHCWCIHCWVWMVSGHLPSTSQHGNTFKLHAKCKTSFTCMRCTQCWLHGLA